MRIHRNSLRLGASITVVALGAAMLPAPALAANCAWGGGSEFWTTVAKWSCGMVPGSSDDAVITAPGSTVTLNGINASAATINLGAGNSFVLSNTFLTVYNHAFTNNGTVTINNASQLRSASGTVAFTGTGTVILDDTTNYAQIGSTGGGFSFDSSQTVRGSGQIGLNQAVISNAGLISANVATRGIDLDAAGGNAGVAAGTGFGTGGIAALYNSGTLQAANGGTLSLEGGLYENSVGGLIQALAGSVVSFNSDSRILNGTLSSAGSGVINAHGTIQYLNSVTLASGTKVDVNNDFLYLNAALANNGTITIANASQLRSELAAVSIGGTGTIVLDDTTNYAQIGSTGGTWALGSGQTVRGSGQIGLNQAIVTNNNVIAADVSGRAVDIDAAGGNGGVSGGVGADGTAGLLNNGVIRATGGGILSFEGGQYDNRPGTISATGGSTINLIGDSRIVGGTLSADATSVINAHGTVQYLNSVTLASGTKVDVNNDFLVLNTTLANNGTVTIANASQLRAETATVSITGTGTIVLDNPGNYAQIGSTGGNWTFGSGQTVRGSGQIGLNQSVTTNKGLISADVTVAGISVDASGNSNGVGAGNGVGTNGNAGFYNTGTVQAVNGSTIVFESGLYENSATGTFAAVGAGSTFLMNNDANLYNLKTGGVLSSGNYTSSTAGAASTLDLRSNAADSIVQIGTNAVGPPTAIVTLDGANSRLNVLGFSSGTPSSIDSSLTTVGQTGELLISNGRVLNIVNGGGAFLNGGLVQLSGGTIGAASYTNTTITQGNGAVTVDIANSGSVVAYGGTLSTRAINGTGLITSTSGGTIDLSAATINSTSAGLQNFGNLALGTHDVTVGINYNNSSFGTGNAFNAHDHVTGTGLILAASATQTLSGPGLTGSTLNVGNVRTGGSSATTLTITNNGTMTNLRGAVQNTNAPSVALTGADFSAAHGGGTATVGISYTGLIAGSLAGQSIKVVNNFDNIASATLNLAGNVYQVAQAGVQPTSVTLAARRVGDAAATSNLTIANTAPVTPGFNEALLANASTAGGFTVNGGSNATATVPAGSTSVVVLGHGTGTAGAFSNAVAIANTSQAVAGSGLSDLALAGQSVTVKANVYATAVATITPTTVDFGTVRRGAASPTASVGVSNTASGALADSLITSASGLPSNVTAVAPGALAAGTSGVVGFTLNTATAGMVNSTGQLRFASHDGELTDVALLSKGLSFAGTVTELASAILFKATGSGSFSGSGTSYTLNLGSLASGSGSYSDNLGVGNTNGGFTYSELLGGSFAQGAGTGYSFSGANFAGIVGGQQQAGDLLSFDTTGLSAGTYTKTITLNGYSSYTGLGNLALAPITLTISALVTGGAVGGVPEPASWAMMLAGFGMVGVAARRRRTLQVVA